ncbi:MAG: fused MFS/spermidine synthase [Zavarzinella sp.]
MSSFNAPRVPVFVSLPLLAVLFVANAASLVMQLLAGRYLAPYVGSSIETWTCIIGVFLTGIAIGNALGGRIADRRPNTKTLAAILLVAALCTAWFVGLHRLLDATNLDQTMGLGVRIVVLAIVFCLPGAITFSFATPLTIKLLLPDVGNAGRIAGFVFALSTLGCLLGNYVTGFWLLASFPLDQITWWVTGILIALAVACYLMNWHKDQTLSTTPSTTKSSESVPQSDLLGFRKQPSRAFAVVFLASFCGMSLELSGMRVLAPTLGVSLYSWTGIIGVMLAGTVLGNYTGGILADRGATVGIQRILTIFFPILMAAIAPVLVRCGFPNSALGNAIAFDKLLHVPEVDGWFSYNPTVLVRIAGAVLGWLCIRFAIKNDPKPYGRALNLLLFGGFLAAIFSHMFVHSLANIIENEKLLDLPKTSLGSAFIYILGFVVGALITLALFYDVNRKPLSFQPNSILGACLLLAAAMCVGVIILQIVFNRVNNLFEVFNAPDIVTRVLAWTFALFFLPMFALGTISPQVIRLTIRDVGSAGRTAGTVYAWSTTGAIVGTFVTGYFLIDLLGTGRILMILAILLTVVAVIVGQQWKTVVLLFAASIVGIGSFVGIIFYGGRPNDSELVYYEETKYFLIAVRHEQDPPVGRGSNYRFMSLDQLIHSFVNVEDPDYLGYEHEMIQAEFIHQARVASKEPARTLVIGGGGYTFPRYVNSTMPEVLQDVVEIDPGVTEAAHVAMGYPRDTRAKSYHMDGRQFIRERAPAGHYDVVIQDAVNDLSVPYHLMTKEYFAHVKKSLKQDGVFLLTLIDSIDRGELWAAAFRTMQAEFPYVYMLQPFEVIDRKSRIVYVIYGSTQPLNEEKLFSAVQQFRLPGTEQTKPLVTKTIPANVLQEALDNKKPIVLTDQYAPVDNLMLNIFRLRVEDFDKDPKKP